LPFNVVHALQNQNIALSDSFNKGDRQLCLDRAKKSVFLAEHFIEIATKEIAREVTESYSIELSAQIQPVRDGTICLFRARQIERVSELAGTRS
jgi:hypothetical protein